MTETVQYPVVGGFALDPRTPLHQLAAKRINNDRDLFIVITAKNSDRGVGKTTLALFLCLWWTNHFTSHGWWCDVEDPAKGMATVDPAEFFEIVDKVGEEFDPGTVIFLDEAEQLTGRRAMDDKNVEFIQRMQMMRKKQAITILALPDPGALDPGIEGLSDVWINVTRRGLGVVHRMGVKSYGSRNITTKRVHKLEFPDVSGHPQMEQLDAMKDAKMAEWAGDAEEGEDGEEGDDGLPLSTQAMIAQELKQKHDVPWSKVADLDDRLTYDGDYLRRNVPETGGESAA